MSLSAKKIAQLVNNKQTSRQEQFEDSLASARRNKAYNAWAWLYDSIEKSEKKRERITGSDYSHLDGVPIGVKDIFNTVTGTTEMGSGLWKGHQAGNDARIISDAVEAGCSILGKTATSEFAVHSLPDVYNPWDRKKTPGTSSSGSAVAVACGDIPIALGTQSAGSISRPASFCGVIGFKPTFGIFPRTGVLKTCDPFDTIGYFCSHYEDIEFLFNHLRLKGSNYPLIELGLKHSYEHVSDSNNTRIGRVITDANNVEDDEIKEKIDNFTNQLPKNYSVDQCDLSTVFLGVRRLQEKIYHKSLAYYFSEERKKGTHYNKVMTDIFDQGDNISSEEFNDSLQNLIKLRKTVYEKIKYFDILVMPTTSSTAPPREKQELIDSSLYWTMLQLPCMSLPLFEHSISNMPFGLQIVGTKKYSDPILFNFIKSLDLLSKSIQHPIL